MPHLHDAFICLLVTYTLALYSLHITCAALALYKHSAKIIDLLSRKLDMYIEFFLTFHHRYVLGIFKIIDM